MSEAHINESLRETLVLQLPVLVEELDSSTTFLTHLAKHNLIKPIDVNKYQQVKDMLQRNKHIVEELIERKDETPSDLSKFVECLYNSHQSSLARLISSSSHEFLFAEQYQRKLEEQLMVVNQYLTKELRRVELRLNPEDEYATRNIFLTTGMNEENDLQQKSKELIRTMQITTRESIAQFDRCRDIIEKLHHDSNEVAHKNASIMAKLRDCDQLLTMSLFVAGIRAFEVDELIDDIKNNDESISMDRNIGKKRQNDADLLEANIRKNIGLLKTHLHCRQDDETLCTSVIDSMTADIRARKAALEMFGEVPTRTDNKYIKAKLFIAKNGIDDKKLLSKNTALTRRLYELAEHLQGYVDIETQTVQKLTANLREGEIKRANDAKSEKDIWLEKIGSIKTIVDARCQKLMQEKIIAAANEKETKKQQRRKLKKTRELRFSESAFMQQLQNLEEDVNQYVSTEQDTTQRYRVEVLRLKSELETELRLRNQQMRELERRLRELERERDKYKRLYDKKTSQKTMTSMVITRPTILKRSPRKDNITSFQPIVLQELRSSNREYRQPRLTSQAKRLTRLRSDIGELERKTVRVKPMPQQQTLESLSVTSMTASTHKLNINENLSSL